MSDLVLTFDIDWAPDVVIDAVADRLIESQVRSTWYVTHASPGIDRLREHPDLFELGIHPNFLPGSTQGATHASVLEHCTQIVPEAKSVRTHSLVQSSQIFATIARETDIHVDCSLYLPRTPELQPVEYRIYGESFCRIPYFWEDDEEMEYTPSTWTYTDIFMTPGLKVVDFHPIHVYLNAPNLETYGRVKQGNPDLQSATQEGLAPHIFEGDGAGTMFDGLLEKLSGHETRTVEDLHQEWRSSKTPIGALL